MNSNNVNVFELNTVLNSIKVFSIASQDIKEKCNEGIYNAEKVLQQTEDELHTSEMMLEAAKVQESICFARKVEIEAKMAQALAEEAAAIYSGNPVAIAAASAYVAEISLQLSQIIEEYNEAVQHRESLQYRYELAIKCVNIAQEMCDTLKTRFNYIQLNINDDIEMGVSRLQNAYKDLDKYLSRISPKVLVELEKWEKWEPQKNKLTNPEDIKNRLNVNSNIIRSILEYIYATDLKFRESIDVLRIEFKNFIDVSHIETKIKKNIVGRLCEEIVIRAFMPIGEQVKTQERFYLEDGSYTKTDMILYGLKCPLVLGRGERMGAREGGNLGIEVKSGNKEYIYSQMEHMEKQAKGHKLCDISCTICTRDIKDLSSQRELELRNRMKEAGSPILGMLPRKSQLDQECICFVKEEEK